MVSVDGRETRENRIAGNGTRAKESKKAVETQEDGLIEGPEGREPSTKRKREGQNDEETTRRTCVVSLLEQRYQVRAH